MGENYYEILGISIDASNEEIKQAYFSLARQYHPDTNPSEAAPEYFLVLQKAYETLRNPKKRKEYDLLVSQTEPEVDFIKISLQLSSPEIPTSPDPQLVYSLIELEPVANNEKTQTAAVHVCFAIDCSTSMKGSRIEMVKDCLYKSIKNLSSNDLISIVDFNDYADILLTPTRINDVEKINNKIRDLHTGGGTEIYKGLKAGVDLLWEGHSSVKNRYLLLLTDGHTYGDEEACFELAQRARQQGIMISTFGIGSDWNDRFLDKLANLTGGSSVFIYHNEDLYNYLSQLTSSLRTIFAHNTSIDMVCDNRVKLNYVFRIEPFVTELSSKSPVYVGDLHTDRKTRLLFAFQVENTILPDEMIFLAAGYIKSEIASMRAQKIQKNYKISVKTKNSLVQVSPPLDILNAISRITMYQMQEKAREDVQKGSIDQAVKKLENMASRLLVQGNQSLANDIIREADYLHKERSFSSDGEKRIKYGTRALLQLPPPTKR